jgi:ATP-dependent helicase/nuclease subunit A
MIDRDARDAIRTELDVNLMVEAAAGTGKTTSLVTRIVALIRTGRCRVQSLAAITFTVKAAAQLRERLHEKLGEAYAETPEGEERARIREAIDELDRAFIGTTHAFCARLLRERPVESGIDPEFEELDELATTLLNETFFARWFDAQAVLDPEGVRRVSEAGLKPAMLRRVFLRLVEYADVEIVATACERPDLGPAVEQVLAFVAEVEPHLPTAAMREKPDAFELMMRDLARRRNSSDLSETLQQLALLDAGDHLSRKATLKNWADGQQAKAFYQRYAVLAEDTVRPVVRRWREYVHCILIDFLRPAVTAFEAERIRNGTLTFNDLLMRARDLLRDHSGVRRYFQRRFTHVLVDEFQDTDPVQAEVLFYLTGREVEERDWRKVTPRAGSLFIVGDPKQSIYRFRRADITTYLTVRELMLQSGGRTVQLNTNFRSARPVCDFVNRSFATLFTQDDVAASRQAPHVDLGPIHEGDAMSGVYVLETPDANQEVVAEAEAACIARWIGSSVRRRDSVWDAGGTREAQYGDFMLVSAYKPRLALYARALQAEGVPFEITGGGAFTKSQEIKDVLPLLEVAADPDDTLSLVAFLRGPLCGASDDALYRFVKLGGRWSLFGEPPVGTDATLAEGLRIAKDALDLARRLPPAAAMARIFERVALPAYATLHEPAGANSGTVMLALALARTWEATSESFAEVVGRLTEVFEKKSLIEELDVDPIAGNVVRLMNMHQVKGLEAPVVFLIDPVDAIEFPVEIAVDRSTDPSRGYLAIQEKDSYSRRDIARPAGWDAHAEREEKFEAAEDRRKLYVAATRAKSMLVIGFRMKKAMHAGVWKELASRVTRKFPSIEHVPVAAPIAGAASSVDDARRSIASRRAVASSESYSVLPVTKVAHADHQTLVRAEEGLGKGMSWGRVLHRLFEAMIRDESLDVRRFAVNLLRDEERDAAELEDVLTLVESVRSSELWKRVMAADERMAEVPFALSVPRRDVGIDEDGDTLLHGAIDLVFREGEEWVVIDYKSDSTAGRLDALVAYYAPQVEHYVKFWARLTGARTTGGLFFVDGAVVVPV